MMMMMIIVIVMMIVVMDSGGGSCRRKKGEKEGGGGGGLHLFLFLVTCGVGCCQLKARESKEAEVRAVIETDPSELQLDPALNPR